MAPEVGLEREVEDPGEPREPRRNEEDRHERAHVSDQSRMQGEERSGEGCDENGTRDTGGPTAVAAAEPRVAPCEPCGRGRDGQQPDEEGGTADALAERLRLRGVTRRIAPRRNDLKRAGPAPESRGDDVERPPAAARHRAAEARDRIEGNRRKPYGLGRGERLHVEAGFGEEGVPRGRG